MNHKVEYDFLMLLFLEFEYLVFLNRKKLKQKLFVKMFCQLTKDLFDQVIDYLLPINTRSVRPSYRLFINLSNLKERMMRKNRCKEPEST